jgi:hypothetical protein
LNEIEVFPDMFGGPSVSGKKGNLSGSGWKTVSNQIVTSMNTQIDQSLAQLESREVAIHRTDVGGTSVHAGTRANQGVSQAFSAVKSVVNSNGIGVVREQPCHTNRGYVGASTRKGRRIVGNGGAIVTVAASDTTALLNAQHQSTLISTALPQPNPSSSSVPAPRRNIDSHLPIFGSCERGIHSVVSAV